MQDSADRETSGKIRYRFGPNCCPCLVGLFQGCPPFRAVWHARRRVAVVPARPPRENRIRRRSAAISQTQHTRLQAAARYEARHSGDTAAHRRCATRVSDIRLGRLLPPVAADARLGQGQSRDAPPASLQGTGKPAMTSQNWTVEPIWRHPGALKAPLSGCGARGRVRRGHPLPRRQFPSTAMAQPHTTVEAG